MLEAFLLRAAAKPLMAIAGLALIFLVGVGATEMWEHRAPGPSITVPFVKWRIAPFGDSLAVQRDAWRNRAETAERLSAARKNLILGPGGWVQRYGELQQLRHAANARAAAQVDTDYDRKSQAAQAASGFAYAAGRVAGRKSCGVNDATASTTGPGGRPGSDRVHDGAPRDLADVWGGGAYLPAVRTTAGP